MPQPIKVTEDSIRLNLKMVWDKLFSTLISARGHHFNTEEYCRKLSELPTSDRAAFIQQNWSFAALGKCQHLLDRITILESQFQK